MTGERVQTAPKSRGTFPNTGARGRRGNGERRRSRQVLARRRIRYRRRVKPAGMASRAAAVIIDALLALVVLGTVVGLATGQTHRSSGSASFNLHGWPAVIWVALSLGYWTVCERLWGMTIGKRLFSIRVEGRDGGRPTLVQSAIRNVLRLLDAFPYVLPYLLGFIVARTNDGRERIGDKVAGTRVVASH